MPAGDVYKVTLEQRYNDTGVIVNNVLYFKLLTPELAGEAPGYVLAQRLSAMIGAGSGSWWDWRFQLHTSFFYDSVRAQRIYPVVELAQVYGVTVAGRMAGGVPLPSASALVVRLRSLNETRRGMGRLFLGGIAYATDATANGSNLLNSGRWQPVCYQRARAWALGMIDNFDGVNEPSRGFVWGVWSRANGGGWPPTEDGFSGMVDAQTDPIVRAVRSRELGVGT